MNTPRGLLALRALFLLLLAVPAIWLAWTTTPVPLLLLIGIIAALISIRAGQTGEARYGRRVPVTEMLALGRQGDRSMLIGGLCGYLMMLCFVAAAVVGWLL